MPARGGTTSLPDYHFIFLKQKNNILTRMYGKNIVFVYILLLNLHLFLQAQRGLGQDVLREGLRRVAWCLLLRLIKIVKTT